jgi:hypothetical protein
MRPSKRSRPSVSNKQPQITIDRLSEDVHAVFDVLNGESDIAIALVGASYVDAALGSALRERFRKSSVSDELLGPNGRLGELNCAREESRRNSPETRPSR